MRTLQNAMLLVALCAGLTAARAEPKPEIKVDSAKCVIVVPGRTNPIVDYAVQELQLHFKLVTGRDLPVTRRPQAGQFPLYVGIRAAGDKRAFAEEEARWVIEPRGVWLYGQDRPATKKLARLSPEAVALNSKSRVGTLFAVYEFLERELGVHWVEPGPQGITYTPSTVLTLTPGRGSWVPQLGQRHMRLAYKEEMRDRALKDGDVPKDMQFTAAEFAQRQHDEIVWQRRMRMGSDVTFTYGHAFRKWWAKYGTTHPEYFALGRNGKRGPADPKHADRVKMCVSNPDLVKQVVADHYANHGGHVIDACENDSRDFCRCPNCEALDVVLPGEEKLDVDDRVLTDRYVHFANAVEEEARKRDPLAQTVFYAYSRYNFPPRRERLDDGIILFLLPNLAMTQAEFSDYYQAWKKANARVVYLRPNDLCQDTGLPLGFEEHMFEKFKLADQAFDLRGTDYDTCWGFWPVSGLADYVMARAFYRPDRSFDYWMNEYCGTYGAARDDIRQYYTYWEQIWNRRVMCNLDRIGQLTGGMKLLRAKMANLPGRLYADEDFDRTDAMLKQALSRKLTDQQRQRVQTLILANEQNRLTYLATKANCLGSTASEAEKRGATRDLYDFRREHRLDLNMNWEQLFYLEDAYSDNAGFERLLGTESPRARALRQAEDRKIRALESADVAPLR